MTIYHVARNGYELGDDLIPFSEQYGWSDETAEMLTERWGCVDADQANELYQRDCGQIHCHETIEQAREFAAEYGGIILAIDDSDLDIRVGREYPHPIINGRVRAELIEAVE